MGKHLFASLRFFLPRDWDICLTPVGFAAGCGQLQLDREWLWKGLRMAEETQ